VAAVVLVIAAALQPALAQVGEVGQPPQPKIHRTFLPLVVRHE
jgi:hypothetical protein